jgi:hypothetical protein
MIIEFTLEVVWLKLGYLHVFFWHLKLVLFGDDISKLLLSKFLRLGGWFRLSFSRRMFRIFGFLP